MIIKTLDFTDKRWELFLQSFQSANIFHSPEMMEVFSKSTGYEIFPVFAMENEEIFAAAFPVLVKVKTPISFNTIDRFFSRLITYSTPLYLNSSKGIEGINQILESLITLAKEKSLFLEIRNSDSFTNGILNSKFKYIPYQNYLIDLSKGKDKIWGSFNSYTRNHIRKSEKNKCTIREIEDSEIDSVIDLIENLYKRKNIPVAERNLFLNAYKLLKPKNYIRVIVIENESNIIGARMNLIYKSKVFDWYAASKQEYNRLYPNEALVWNTIQWSIKNNCTLFDFGGGAIKGKYYGPAKFKEKFKGELVEFGRHRFITNKFLYNLGNKLYELSVKS